MDEISRSGYSPIRSSVESDSIDETEDDSLMANHPEKTKFPSRRACLLVQVINMIVFIISAVCLGVSISYHHQPKVLNADLRRTSSWSPIHDMIDLQPRIAMINGTLFPPKDPSIARQLPNSDADDKWAEYELLRVIPVPRKTIIRLGKNPETAVKLDNNMWGLGDDAYGVVFDVYHQLHCLNSLRKIAYGSYYNESMGRADKLKLREIHINHCADILFQALTCSGNVNLMTLHWVETQERPWPDMSINRQCIDFDRLTDFRKQVSLDMDRYRVTMNKPEGVTELPAPDHYYELFGEKNPNHLHGEDPEEDHIL
ncbi:hypothetical protein PFICI_13528 [Pestalotiopsis fici W106-1]|uniref:Tat pathway signal sequence n=1 Tax=Pestalotiopsis fici (strain W106-1 / CGMCC3.15140) TaxID=1229662 RepID=W3WMQ2_PESFW|nr:uncharacterized protein PFICI_13528 [Pestalotiopsis fici W106-1]ETS75044.1 hypothetical protein PFICI_13528 [Pestalotiopsis fici W106-1]